MYFVVYKEDATSAFLLKETFSEFEDAKRIATRDIEQQQGFAHIYMIEDSKIYEVAALRYMPYWGDKGPVDSITDNDDEETVFQLAY